MKHPNAMLASGMTPLALLLYQGVKALGYELSPDEAILYAGGVVTVALFVGRRGIVGVAKLLWRGSGAIIR